GIGFA
ncbi:hypothetical protein MK372_10075, partial [Streptococcus oralis]